MIYNCEQGSPEWFALREKRLTSSHGQEIGNAGKGLNSYIEKKILELIVGKDDYVNSDIDRGNELEPIARVAYEFKTGNKVEQVGFITKDDFFEDSFGASPDGLVGEDGGIEIKARNNKIHLQLLLTEKIDSKTLWQIQGNLFVTGRKWWDFVSYNPNFKNYLFIKRIYPDAKMIEKLKIGVEIGVNKFKKMLNEQIISDECNSNKK